MKIALNWLKRYIDIYETTSELSDILTFSGIEVEGITELKAMPETVITAKIVSAEALPKSDHLKICKVSIGNYQLQDSSILDDDGLLQIVCGAPNCAGGQVAILALPGTDLGEIKIQSAKLRGVVSHGMLCSEKELGISDDHSGIIVLPDDLSPGLSPNSLYELPDTIFELEITPNRGDLLGYIGIARDLSASLDRELRLPIVNSVPSESDQIGIKLKIDNPEMCYRYTARVFDGIEVKPSPLWLKVLLTKAGLRPINNIVDITNYVMLCTGHPLHAFDYELLDREQEGDKWPSIIVRTAEQNEKIKALDGKEYSLREIDLVIADGKKASAIAGVMGGELSGISADTKKIVLESAAFNQTAVRKTSYFHKISTDSSYRFERGVSPQVTDEVSELATSLIVELSSPSEVSPVIDCNYWMNKPMVLGIRPGRFEEIIGYKLSDEEIRTYLERLGLKFIQYGTWIEGQIEDISKVHCHHLEEAKAGKKEFTEAPDCIHSHYYKIPYRRLDLTREIDLIEELARLAGYDRVPHKTAISSVMDQHAYLTTNKVEDYLVSRGFFETLNFSFTDPTGLSKLGIDNSDVLSLINPQSSNQSVMRSTLLPSILDNAAYNINRGEKNLKLFESARTYHKTGDGIREVPSICAVVTGNEKDEHWAVKNEQVSFYHIKGVISQLCELLGIDAEQCPVNKTYLINGSGLSYKQNDIELAYFGKLRPDMAERFSIDTLTMKQDLWILEFKMNDLIEVSSNRAFAYSDLPRYPSVTRDLSFLLPLEHSYADLSKETIACDPELIEELSIFDEYRSKQIPAGYRSVSIHLFLRDKQKTLTEERIEQVVESVVKKLQEKLQIIMR